MPAAKNRILSMPYLNNDTSNPMLHLRPVRRLSDGKIFSCPLGAAYSYTHGKNMPRSIKYIEDCCNGIVLEFEGSKWEWAKYKYSFDFGNFYTLRERALALLPHKEQSIYDAYGKAKDSRHREACKSVSSFFSEKGLSFAEPFGAWEVHTMYVAWCFLNDVKSFIRTSNSFARNLRAWSILYAKLCGIDIFYADKEVKVQYNPSLRVHDFTFNSVIPEYGVDASANSLLPINPKRTFPVYCPKMNYTYIGFVNVSKSLGADRLEVRLACYGDIDKVSSITGNVSFAFGKWENVNPADLIMMHRKSSSRMVLDVLSGKVYKSILAASKDTGIYRNTIRNQCMRYLQAKKLGTENAIPEIVVTCGTEMTAYKFRFFDQNIDYDAQGDFITDEDGDKLYLG